MYKVSHIILDRIEEDESEEKESSEGRRAITDSFQRKMRIMQRKSK